jgi:hypothetical protein
MQLDLPAKNQLAWVLLRAYPNACFRSGLSIQLKRILSSWLPVTKTLQVSPSTTATQTARDYLLLTESGARH